jgi:parallel beta-helix repeat protein
MVLALWMAMGRDAQAQDTFIVNDDTAPAADGCDTPDFQTEDIEDAIDSGLLADGDTLVICDGTYSPADPIEVTKDLTIEGRANASRDDIIMQGASDGFDISVDGVTLRHLTLVGTGAGGDNGVHVLPGTNDNRLEDLEISEFEDGIFIDDAEGNVVEGCETHDNLDAGIQASNGSRNVIRINQSTANNNGVFLMQENEALVEGNTLSSNTDQQIWLNQRVNVRILRNTITTAANSNGILVDIMPAESLVIIGDRAQDANTFSGPFDPAGGDYYVNLVCGSENTVNATNNWWGSTNRTDIANRIFNDEDDQTVECAAPNDVRGAVVFQPSLPPPTPTPTPTPGAVRWVNSAPNLPTEPGECASAPGRPAGQPQWRRRAGGAYRRGARAGHR